MRDLDKVDTKADVVVFLASFHHLKSDQERVCVLEKAKSVLNTGGRIVMTNWNLKSPENAKKYVPTEMGGSEYEVKIGNSMRYYHAFSLEELSLLAKHVGLSVEKNSGQNDRNFVSVFRK